MSGTTDEIPAAVLDVLAPPAPGELNGDQTRGRACVWCGVALTVGTTVPLGERMAPAGGSGSTAGVRRLPGACHGCVAGRAHRGLFAHGSTCELCADKASADACTVGRGLYRLIRKHRQ